MTTIVEELVTNGLGQWAPAATACAAGEESVYGTLAPSLTKHGITFPAHILRVVQATITGMTNPGDGSYATRLVAAHEEAGIGPDLVGLVWVCTTVLPCPPSRRFTLGELNDYMAAARTHGRHIRVSEHELGIPLSEMGILLQKHFRAVNTLPEGALADFWAVMDNSHVRQEVLGNATDAQIIAGMEPLLPPNFVRLFAR